MSILASANDLTQSRLGFSFPFDTRFLIVFSTPCFSEDAILLNLAIEPLESGLKRFVFADFDFRHSVSPPRGAFWRRFSYTKYKKHLIDPRENYSPALFLCQGFRRICLLRSVSGLPPKGEYEDDEANNDNTEQADSAVKQDCRCRQRLTGSQRGGIQ